MAMTTDQAAHVWANQSKPAGSGGKGSVYFEGPALYSYGSHFLTGFIVGGTALLNAEKYGVTTSRHQSDARSASRHLRQFTLPNLTDIREPLIWNANPARFDHTKQAQAIIRKWLRDNAPQFQVTDWRGETPLEGAVFVASLFKLNAANVGAEIKRGTAAKAKQKAELAARDRRDAIERAKRLADMTDSEFAEWAHRSAHVFEPQSFSYVSTMEKSVAALAKRLSVAARLGSKVIGKRRVEALKARRAALLTQYEGMAQRAIASDRAAAVATFQEWATRWRSADDMASKFAAMKNAPASWRYHDSGKAHTIEPAELAELQTAEQWARDHETERRALVAEIAAREAEQRRERDLATFNQWQAGASVQCPASFRSFGEGFAYVRRRGDNLETSQGASVPWAHAVKAFQFIKLCRERGEGWRTNGRIIRVGHFQVNEITPAGNMTAGCHKFAWNDIERLARAEGVFEAPASAEVVEAR
jgi:hypothetical protein